MRESLCKNGQRLQNYGLPGQKKKKIIRYLQSLSAKGNRDRALDNGNFSSSSSLPLLSKNFCLLPSVSNKRRKQEKQDNQDKSSTSGIKKRLSLKPLARAGRGGEFFLDRLCSFSC